MNLTSRSVSSQPGQTSNQEIQMPPTPESPNEFVLNEQVSEVLWAVHAAARAILAHPDLEAQHVLVIGRIMQAIERLPQITLEEPIAIGLDTRNRGTNGVHGGWLLRILAAPDQFEISQTLYEHDPAIGTDHNSTVLCHCESTGFSQSETEILVIPYEFEQMIEQDSLLFIEDTDPF